MSVSHLTIYSSDRVNDSCIAVAISNKCSTSNLFRHLLHYSPQVVLGFGLPGSSLLWLVVQFVLQVFESVYRFLLSVEPAKDFILSRVR